jgi:transcriptional regulator with XRE-family HTH domain
MLTGRSRLTRGSDRRGYVRPRMTVGERIRTRRRELGLSQRELACDGVTYAYISRLEANARTPSVRALRKLAAKLDVSAHWLETGEQDPAEQLAQLVLDHDGRVLPPQATRLARAMLRERRPPSG